jgi:hypothetical protein
VYADLERRRTVIRSFAAETPVDLFRPFAERGTYSGYGAHCGLGDSGFQDWTCDDGLTCQPHDAVMGEAATVGICLPETARVGDPCEASAIRAHANPRRDRVPDTSVRPCSEGAATCNRSQVGFPGGMCTASCADLPDDGACGRIAILTSFNECLAKSLPFSDCLIQHSNPAGLRRCSANQACRDDYLCARTASGEGTCIPPYFLFQLRVDGHPKP